MKILSAASAASALIVVCYFGESIVKPFMSMFAVAMFVTATTIGAAEQTWIGEISDSACGAQHESGTENVPAPPAKECVAACVRGGSKYVLLSDGKVLQITNQDAPGLTDLAGAHVKITGELQRDAISVTKIEKTE